MKFYYIFLLFLIIGIESNINAQDSAYRWPKMYWDNRIGDNLSPSEHKPLCRKINFSVDDTKILEKVLPGVQFYSIKPMSKILSEGGEQSFSIEYRNRDFQGHIELLKYLIDSIYTPGNKDVYSDTALINTYLILWYKTRFDSQYHSVRPLLSCIIKKGNWIFLDPRTPTNSTNLISYNYMAEASSISFQHDTISEHVYFQIVDKDIIQYYSESYDKSGTLLQKWIRGKEWQYEINPQISDWVKVLNESNYENK
jgi:hypothetical protein